MRGKRNAVESAHYYHQNAKKKQKGNMRNTTWKVILRPDMYNSEKCSRMKQSMKTFFSYLMRRCSVQIQMRREPNKAADPSVLLLSHHGLRDFREVDGVPLGAVGRRRECHWGGGGTVIDVPFISATI